MCAANVKGETKTLEGTEFGSKLGHHFMRNRLMLKANGHRLWQH
jgi:hypothetical protein